MQACLILTFLINLCSELCGFSQTISIQIIHVSMYYLWRFFIHKLIRIPNFWSMRTRMREDADKDGPSGLTSRMNKILSKNRNLWCILIKILQHKDFLHDITDRIITRISLVLKPNIRRFVDKQEFQLISSWRALCNVDLDNLIDFH